MTAGEAKNVDNAVVLARLFNEASGQKAPSKKHGLFISRPLVPVEGNDFLVLENFRGEHSTGYSQEWVNHSPGGTPGGAGWR
ncbi:MAG: hypothetical protein ACI92C_002794 [Neolewinella sp.]